MLGMGSSTFRELEKELIGPGSLAGGKYITVTERLAIFLYMCRFAVTCRQAADGFGHSATSIGTPVADRITGDPGLFPFFKDVIGAIDGSHVPAHAPLKIRDRFWNRKGRTSFNVLAACDFDMCFIYILGGWEGSASDSLLWQKAQDAGLKLGNKKLLGDAGFGFSSNLLIPYRGVRYHLKEYSVGTRRPRNEKELCNRRHAGARNVIERVFGVLQARFKILTTGCHFALQTQADLFPALAVVHNLIRQLDPDNDIEGQLLDNTDQRSAAGEEQPQTTRTAEARDAAAHRDRIAKRMWTKYRRQ
ncbi:unnamed protein product [Tilletia controversa]|uniref:DDE Tnp4 domain-containing protein n=1 Tax=Tilletia controversa TaxID=13291 RepID=A0A8X7MK76_9BASI|nr:hypothetical protein A4X06_0g8975 [Tilletia controversa]CAD6976941.1 unnamed protein product [Tilletia controversa]